MPENERSQSMCPGHDLLVFKLDDLSKRFTSQEADVKAVLAVVSELQGNRAQIRTHDITLFGVDLQGGLTAEVRQLKEDKAFRNKAWAAILTFITGNLALLWALYNSVRTAKGSQ